MHGAGVEGLGQIGMRWFESFGYQEPIGVRAEPFETTRVTKQINFPAVFVA